MAETISKAEADALEAADKKYVMRPWTHPKGEPVIIAKGKGCLVWDVHGKEYLDLTAGYFVNNAGHCHPRIIEAATKQLHEVLQVSGKHGTPATVNLAKKLIEILPGNMGKVFFSTGGSESNEFALKIARQYTKKTDVAYLVNGYHGLTLGALEVTASQKYRDSAGKPMGTDNYALPIPYPYRSSEVGTEAETLAKIEKLFDAHPNTAAIIAEPIQAVGGMAPSKEWWTKVDQLRRARGILFIADEVQTGLGRTGKMFAIEHYGLEPDIITGGKGLSGGVGSLAMTAATDEVLKPFFGGTTPTSGGNAVSAAAGLAMIETVIAEGLVENAAKMGRYFTEACWALKDPWIGDVRFHGLLGGVELVSNRDTKAVLGKNEMAKVKDGLHDAGMLITVSGWHGNVLRLQPALSVTSAELDRFVAALRKVLVAVRGS
ncbi:MAG TPA: aspartate aminotransferase family protein [Kofleriaceae bacterium]|jgi:4-aminobutyrate aminotransferase-like enzyme